MDCSGVLYRNAAVVLLGLGVTGVAGCIGPLLATGIYVAQGGNVVPADFDGLKNHRVVVLCRPPASHEFRHAGASRNIAHRVGQLIQRNVKGVQVVDQKEVDNWMDESGGEEFKDLGRAVDAEMLVHVELDDFALAKGRTLYQGRAEATVTVYDMKDGEKAVWDSNMGEILYPRNSGIPAVDKSPQRFQREFEEIVAETIAVKFYKHDPHKLFAMDALANR
jgi:hypothetical protein